MSDSPVSLSSSVFPSVVDRLRAAGCVFAEDEARLLLDAAASPAELDAMVARRVGGLPLEHVLGWANFCGLRIAVDPGVFVPRPRTEFLVQQAAELAPPGAVVVDLCCGSGALGVALARRLGASGQPVELHAADIDPAAVACARRNVAPLGGHAYEGDLFAALPPAASLRGRIDVLLANVPYVPTGDIPLLPAEAREHEALVALDGGADGLAVLRRVTAQAATWLAPGGAMLVETSEHQETPALAAFTAAGLVADVATSDDYWSTVLIGRRPTR